MSVFQVSPREQPRSERSVDLGKGRCELFDEFDNSWSLSDSIDTARGDTDIVHTSVVWSI